MSIAHMKRKRPFSCERDDISDAIPTVEVIEAHPQRTSSTWKRHPYEFKYTSQPDFPNEEWRQVPNGHGAAVSSLGRFQSTRGVISAPSLHSSGYVQVVIAKKHHMVHRLMAIAFDLPRPSPQHTQVNHKNLNPSDNRLINLEWVTPAQNLEHSRHTNVNRLSSGAKQSRPVWAKKIEEKKWELFSSACEAARAFGLAQGNVSKCVRGEIRHTGGIECCLASSTEEELSNEEWRDIPWGNGAAVSSLGRYRSCKGFISMGVRHKDGYCTVCVAYKVQLVHRLVAAVFELPRVSDEHKQVNHKNRIPWDNRLENLEWVTLSENVQHSYQHSYQTNTGRISCGPKLSRSVLVRSVASTEWVSYASIQEAACALGICPTIIVRRLHRRRTQHL